MSSRYDLIIRNIIVICQFFILITPYYKSNDTLFYCEKWGIKFFTLMIIMNKLDLNCDHFRLQFVSCLNLHPYILGDRSLSIW